MAVKSAERVFRIFELLEQSPEGLTNKEVSSLLGFAPSSTLALLQTMEENFLLRKLVKNGNNKKKGYTL